MCLSYDSNEAATYDARQETALAHITESIRERLGFLGVNWAEDDDDSGDGQEAQQGAKAKPHKRPVRLLDYACGTGSISRVNTAPGIRPLADVRLAAVQAGMPPLPFRCSAILA